MNFRARLRLFFVLLVALPMVALAIVLSIFHALDVVEHESTGADLFEFLAIALPGASARKNSCR